jgi:hypothetical protein
MRDEIEWVAIAAASKQVSNQWLASGAMLWTELVFLPLAVAVYTMTITTTAAIIQQTSPVSLTLE